MSEAPGNKKEKRLDWIIKQYPNYKSWQKIHKNYNAEGQEYIVPKIEILVENEFSKYAAANNLTIPKLNVLLKKTYHSIINDPYGENSIDLGKEAAKARYPVKADRTLFQRNPSQFRLVHRAEQEIEAHLGGLPIAVKITALEPESYYASLDGNKPAVGKNALLTFQNMLIWNEKLPLFVPEKYKNLLRANKMYAAVSFWDEESEKYIQMLIMERLTNPTAIQMDHNDEPDQSFLDAIIDKNGNLINKSTYSQNTYKDKLNPQYQPELIEIFKGKTKMIEIARELKGKYGIPATDLHGGNILMVPSNSSWGYSYVIIDQEPIALNFDYSIEHSVLADLNKYIKDFKNGLVVYCLNLNIQDHFNKAIMNEHGEFHLDETQQFQHFGHESFDIPAITMQNLTWKLSNKNNLVAKIKPNSLVGIMIGMPLNMELNSFKQKYFESINPNEDEKNYFLSDIIYDNLIENYPELSDFETEDLHNKLHQIYTLHSSLLKIIQAKWDLNQNLIQQLNSSIEIAGFWLSNKHINALAPALRDKIILKESNLSDTVELGLNTYYHKKALWIYPHFDQLVKKLQEDQEVNNIVEQLIKVIASIPSQFLTRHQSMEE